MLILYSLTSAAVLISFLVKKGETFKAFHKAWKMFLKVLPSLLVMMVLSSVFLYFFPPEKFREVLSSDRPASLLIAAVLGSITLVPGFIVFPLMGLLREQGISFMIISVFTTTLMMVGVVTFPVERLYLGTRLAVMRNLTGLVIALLVALATGIVFGDITL